MNDFILNNKKFLAYYIGLWLFSATGLFFVLFKTTSWSAGAILADSLISSFTLYAVLIALWFVVRFAGGYSAQTPGKLLSAMLAALVLVMLWVFITMAFIDLFTRFEPDYGTFFLDTIWIRALTAYILSALVNLMFYTFFMIRHSREAMERENQLRDLVQRTELQALKNQLNPHFIYNSLNSISSLTITAPEKAREMVIRLSDFLRYALKQDVMQMTSLKKELENIESYLQIEKVRFGDRLKYRLDLDPESSSQAIPVMILQPLFENAVKHGVQNSTEPVEIIFELEKKTGEIKLKVSNTFDGQFTRFRSEGVGLENIRNRLRLIYGNGNLLSVKADAGIFTASLSLPQIEFNDDI
jgi:two-component system, LytTR family, sensor kinase